MFRAAGARKHWGEGADIPSCRLYAMLRYHQIYHVPISAFKAFHSCWGANYIFIDTGLLYGTHI